MPKNDIKNITLSTWNKVASLCEKIFMDLDLYNESYDLFCKQITDSKPNILEIGCGPGNITRYISNKIPGVKITAIDYAPNMITIAQKNNPKAICKVMDCKDISQFDTKFNAILCGFCMPYLSQEDCSKLIYDIQQLLTTNGILYFSTIEDDYSKSGFETSSSGDRAYVYYHQAQFFEDLLPKNNLALISTQRIKYQKANGTKQIHLIMMAKKQV